MLLLKKAEIEQQLEAELKRIRNIESRLQAIRDVEHHKPLNVVLKQLPAQPVLSVRTMIPTFEAGLIIFGNIRQALPEKNGYGMLFCICHSDAYVEQDIDLELGRVIEAASHPPVPLNGGLQLTFRKQPALGAVATTVVTGALETIHTGYRQIGAWVEANGYRLAGRPRELTLQSPRAADGSDLITEIQFPVESIRQT